MNNDLNQNNNNPNLMNGGENLNTTPTPNLNNGVSNPEPNLQSPINNPAPVNNGVIVDPINHISNNVNVTQPSMEPNINPINTNPQPQPINPNNTPNNMNMTPPNPSVAPVPNNVSPNNGGNNKSFIIIIVLIVILVALASGGAVYLVTSNNQNNQSVNNSNNDNKPNDENNYENENEYEEEDSNSNVNNTGSNQNNNQSNNNQNNNNSNNNNNNQNNTSNNNNNNSTSNNEQNSNSNNTSNPTNTNNNQNSTSSNVTNYSGFAFENISGFEYVVDEEGLVIISSDTFFIINVANYPYESYKASATDNANNFVSQGYIVGDYGVYNYGGKEMLIYPISDGQNSELLTVVSSPNSNLSFVCDVISADYDNALVTLANIVNKSKYVGNYTNYSSELKSGKLPSVDKYKN